MTFDVQSLKVQNNRNASRFETDLGGGKFAIIQYRRNRNIYVMIHTEVPAEFRGKGIAEKLVHDALEMVKAENLDTAEGRKVDPQCPVVKAFIDRHPEYKPLVAMTA
ncbi:MAG: N-acetyltransferase [Anaerolineae bacterium]|nr:N-acetyltransferase [Anaerolineae bacterium]